MNAPIRSWFTVLAVLVFLGLAPVLLSRAAGYQWGGWQLGFTKSSALTILSSPRSSIYLNQRLVGTTPKRIGNLPPGGYQITLTAETYGSWSKFISIRPGQALEIGPIILLPDRFSVKTLTVPAESRWLNDPASERFFSVQKQVPIWLIRPWLPESEEKAWWSANAPTAIQLSPDRRWALVSSDNHVQVFSRQASQPAWTLDTLTNISWDDRSNGIWYGLRDGWLHRLDMNTQTDTKVAQVSSYHQHQGLVWYTSLNSGQTVLQQASPSGQIQTLMGWPEPWAIVAGHKKQLVLRRVDSGQSQLWSISAFNVPGLPLDMGRTDRWYWEDGRSGILWQDGVSLKTFDQRQKVTLLDRGPEVLTKVQWLTPKHLLISVDDTSVSIRSVSSRQGHGVLLNQSLPPGGQVTFIEPNKRRLWVATHDRVETWSWE